MSAPVKLLAVAGSTRAGSFNKKLIRIAADAARSAGAEVTLVDLLDFPLPLYDGDLESQGGLPENAKKLKALMLEQHGFLISAPEYNSSITAVLKNAIDWASRAERDDEPPLACFDGKSAALMSASPGALGGLRGLVHLRAILGNLGMHVLPDQVSVPKVHEAFDEAARLKDARNSERVAALARALVDFTRRLRD
jgi:NAD(P)H-dependent FMN reductase